MAVAGFKGLSGSEDRRTRRFASTGTPWRTGRAAQASILRASSLHGVLLARMRTAQSPDESPKRSFFCGRDVSPSATRSPRHGEAVDRAGDATTLSIPTPTRQHSRALASFAAENKNPSQAGRLCDCPASSRMTANLLATYTVLPGGQQDGPRSAIPRVHHFLAHLHDGRAQFDVAVAEGVEDADLL